MDSTKETIKETGVTIVKSLFGAIPYVGSALDEVFFGHFSRLRQNRINRFVEEFERYLKSHDLSNIDTNDMKSEHFIDAFTEIISSIAKTSSERKIEYFKRILTRLVIVPIGKNDFLPTFLDILEKVNETEIMILEYFYKLDNDGVYYSEYQRTIICRTINSSFGLSEDEYTYYKMSLFSKCLLQDDAAPTPPNEQQTGKSFFDLEAQTRPMPQYLQRVKISYLGSGFIEFLTNH